MKTIDEENVIPQGSLALLAIASSLPVVDELPMLSFMTIVRRRSFRLIGQCLDLGIVCFLLTFGLHAQESRAAREDLSVQRPSGPPMLSIGSFAAVNMFSTDVTIQSALPDLLASELVKRYDVQVLSRSRCHELVIENSIEALSHIDDLKMPPYRIVAADYAIAGHFTRSSKGNSFQGYVFGIDLRSADGGKPRNRSFEAASVETLAGAMADAVAEMFSLGAKPAAPAVPPGNTLTWAVLPFGSIHGHEPAVKISILAESAENALSSKGNVRLIDRATLDPVLKELSRPFLIPGIAEGMKVGEILRADRILLGFVTQQGEGWRLDIQVVEARTGAIIAAQYETNQPLGRLAESTAVLTLELADHPAAFLFRPSSPDTRRREAEFFISDDYFPMQIAWSDSNTRVYWAKKVRSAETAYLLQHQDRQFSYEVLRNLSDWFKNSYAEGVFFEKSQTTVRAVRLINAALASYENSDKTPYPLILRAEALKSVDQIDDAKALIAEHEKEHSDAGKERLMFVKAWCAYKSGDIPGADALVRAITKDYGNNDAVAWLMTKVQQHPFWQTGQTDAAQYARLTTLMHTANSWPRVVDLEEFLDLGMTIEGPGKTLGMLGQTLQHNIKMGRATAVFQYEYVYLFYRALCCEALGQKEEAVRHCDEIIASVNESPTTELPGFQTQSLYRQKAVDLRSRLVKETGPVTSLWKSAAATRTFPARFTLYLVPVGDADRSDITNASKVAGQYFGANVAVLPSIPVPNMARQEGKKLRRDAYSLKASDFMEIALTSMVVPDDAILVVFVTNLRLEESTFDYLYSPSFSDARGARYNPFIISACQASSYNPGNHVVYSKTVAWKIIAEFRTLYMGRKEGSERWYNVCSREFRFPCVHAELPESYQGLSLLFSMCPACQKDYCSADFDKIHQDLMDYLKKAGAKIVLAVKTGGVEDAAKP